MCQPRVAPGRGGWAGCACGCCGCGCGPGLHHIYSPQNEQKRLKDYQDQLERELKAVGERIKECECS